jgi:hypothetical protein
MKITLHTIALIVSALALALCADAWRSARHDAAQLSAVLDAQKTVIAQAAEREKSRDAQLATAIDAIASQKNKIQTPRQAAVAIPSVLPPLPLPVSIQFPNLAPSSKSTSPNSISPALAPPLSNGDLPAALSIPQADLIPLYDDLQNCRATTLERDSAQKDLADEKIQNAAMSREREAAITAAHGGPFWVRLKREAKWFAIGIAVGAASTKLSHR